MSFLSVKLVSYFGYYFNKRLLKIPLLFDTTEDCELIPRFHVGRTLRLYSIAQ